MTDLIALSTAIIDEGKSTDETQDGLIAFDTSGPRGGRNRL